MKKVYSGRMTSKGQVTIPQEIRMKYGLSEGDRLEFIINEQTAEYMTVTPVKKMSIADVAGSLSSEIKVADLSFARHEAIDKSLQEKFNSKK
jgi:antitoxin PrlF